MKFSRVIGKVDPNLVIKAEEKLSKVFLELAVRYDNTHIGSGYGGDALVFSLMFPVDQICSLNIPTAATNGKYFIWNPKFVLKNSIKGLRIICAHEAWHAIYMHPARRGSRNPKLWNIAVDYIVNGMVMEDFTARHLDPVNEFSKNLGRYMTLPQFIELVKNPNAKIPGFEDLNPKIADPNAPSPGMPGPTEDRELTPKELAELEKREKGVRFFYADPALADEMKRPEAIYDLLYHLLPKCTKCGRLGMYKPPSAKQKPSKKKDEKKGKKGQKEKQEAKDQEKQDQGDQGDQQDQGQGDQGQGDGGEHNHDQDGNDCDCDGQNQGQGNGDCEGGCGECGGGIDIFGLGGTTDDHLDSEETQEKLAKRISEAMESAKKLAGHVPAGLEDELGKLTAPKITWKDVIRCRLLKARAGNGHNDWTRFKTRPMFSGLLVPKRKSFIANFGCLIDTSGSMSNEDMAFGISQLQSLDEKCEGYITPCDTQAYWDATTRIKKCNAEQLSQMKVVGRGGTCLYKYFEEYEKAIGKVDFIIMITDGFLDPDETAQMKNPGVDVFWLLTANSGFVAPFGKSYMLRDL
jgi:predicted metal-dependent peptidase